MRERKRPLVLVYSEVFVQCGPLTLKLGVRQEYWQDPNKGLFCYTLDMSAVCFTEFHFRLDYSYPQFIRAQTGSTNTSQKTQASLLHSGTICAYHKEWDFQQMIVCCQLKHCYHPIYLRGLCLSLGIICAVFFLSSDLLACTVRVLFSWHCSQIVCLEYS